MGVQRALHKVDPRFQQHDPVPLRQAGRCGLTKIDRKAKRHSGHGLGPQQTNAPCLDQTGKCGRRAGDKGLTGKGHVDLVIRNQNRPKADHLQGKG